jgi:flagellar basal-body rod modification protein FlgD
MNALVAIRALGDEPHALSRSKRAEAARGVASQQTPAKAVQAAATSTAAAAVKAATTTSPTTTAAKAATSTTGTDAVRQVTKELDRDAFLQLLVYQLQNQDPLNPTDNGEMIAQLAQFSALEQMNNLNESFTTVSESMDRLNFVSASALVGRTVSGTALDGNTIQGTVERVYMDSDNSVYLMVGTTPIALTDIQHIDGVAS